MAINLNGIGTVLKRGAEKFFDQPNGEVSQHEKVTKRIKVDVSYEGHLEQGALITVEDLKTGNKEQFRFKYIAMMDQLIEAMERRDMATVRVLRAMETFEDLPVLWKEEWKNKRCMYQGVPNAAAMSLLTGLRKPIPMGWVRQKDGNAFRGGIVSRLFKADLMRAKHLDKGRVTYSTNGNGYDVLKHWAGKNKLFAPYLQVFLPDGWEENELATQTFLAMHGRLPERKSANALSRYYTEGSPK